MKSNLTIKDSSFTFVSAFLFCGFFSALMLVVLTLFLHINIENFDLEAFSDTAIGTLFSSVTLQVGLLLVFLYINKSKDNKLTDNFSWKKLGLYSIIAIISLLLLSPAVSCIENLLSKIGFEEQELKFDLNVKNYFLCLISMVILPAVCEELVFRGIIFKGIKPHGKNISTFLSALAFSIFHMSVFQTIYPLLFGILLGIIMYKENNIIYTITMHFINNLLSLSFIFLGIDFFVNHWLFFVLAIALLIVFVLGIVYIIKSTKETDKKSLSKNEIIYIILSFVIMLVLWTVFNIYGK